jgi:hypothetical protein
LSKSSKTVIKSYKFWRDKILLVGRDAIAAAEKLSTKMKVPQLSNIQTVEKPHYAKRGKPQPDAIPTSISYRITATVIPIDPEILSQRQRCGRFILATNILDPLESV